MNKSEDRVVWTDARDLYRELAIPTHWMRFEDWFTARIQNEFKVNTDWRVDGDGDDLQFWITEQVAYLVAQEEIGMPVRKVGLSHEVALTGWNETNNPQTHAITDDLE